jgi:ornithine decarboxylase
MQSKKRMRRDDDIVFRLVLRIVTDDSNAICRFSMKFGADMNTSRRLIEKAQEIDMEIIGVR